MKIPQILAGLLILASVAGAEPRVEWAAAEWVLPNDRGPDGQAIRKTLMDYWQAYESQDLTGILATLQPNLRRCSRRAGRPQKSRAQVARELPAEWAAFERRQGRLCEKVRLRRGCLRVSGSYAFTTYWVEAVGGDRWDYSDQGLIWQTLMREGDQWRIAYHSESWSLGFDLDGNRPGAPTPEFDYVYPVHNLKRALAYYQPLLGKPEFITDQRASFNLGGPRFQLAVNPLGGLASVRPGYPAGYAVFHVADVRALQQRLLKTGNPFFLGSQSRLLEQGPDRYIVVADPSGNPVVLLQQNMLSQNSGEGPVIVGFESKERYVQAAERVARALFTTSVEDLWAWTHPDCRWFDDTRNRTIGVQQGREQLLNSLQQVYWPGFDRGSAGLKVRLEAKEIEVRSLSEGAMVSYQATLTGTGSHPFVEPVWVTQRFDRQQKLLESFTVRGAKNGGLAKELDYAAYPVTDLSRGHRFYSQMLNLGQPYKDTDYFGWWSNFSVFGIYQASPKADGLPQSGRANGYVSFWVDSAQQAFSYAQKHGGQFPVIPAINDESGVSGEPGYRQVYTTDSEGNGLLFSEYP